MRTPWTFDHGRDRARDAKCAVRDHGVGLSHAFVDTGGHVVEELARAALDEHLGDRLACLPMVCVGHLAVARALVDTQIRC